jgi:LysM repeat protein
MRTIAAMLVALCALVSTAHAQRVHAQRGWYVVRPGDTLAEIARRHRVSIEALQRENELRADAIRPGDRLHIPRGASADSSTALRAGVPARRYRVREGDSLARIARRHRVSVEDVQRANGLRGDAIRPGQTLWIPRDGVSGAEVRAALREENPATDGGPAPLDDARMAEAAARARELGLGPTSVGQRLEPGAGSALDRRRRRVRRHGWHAARAGRRRPLPARLARASGYASIDIGGGGTLIRAAERGSSRTARGIRGYGNFVVLVRERVITAYALARATSPPGQLVDRGEVIALVGQTGFAQAAICLHVRARRTALRSIPLPAAMVTRDGAAMTCRARVDSTLQPSGVRMPHARRSSAPVPLRQRRERASSLRPSSLLQIAPGRCGSSRAHAVRVVVDLVWLSSSCSEPARNADTGGSFGGGASAARHDEGRARRARATKVAARRPTGIEGSSPSTSYDTGSSSSGRRRLLGIGGLCRLPMFVGGSRSSKLVSRSGRRRSDGRVRRDARRPPIYSGPSDARDS